MDLNENITLNFKWIEFFYSHLIFEQNFTDNLFILNNIKILAETILQPIRNEFGPITITSGFRTKKLNQLVKGSNTSDHLTGSAADFVPSNKNIELFQIVKWIHKNLEWGQLICEYFPNGWIHISLGNKKEFLIKNNKYNYKKVTMDFLKEIYEI